MTGRDFKLLVREYFQELMLSKIDGVHLERMEKAKTRILSELESFTNKEQEELPFKETHNP